MTALRLLGAIMLKAMVAYRNMIAWLIAANEHPHPAVQARAEKTVELWWRECERELALRLPPELLDGR